MKLVKCWSAFEANAADKIHQDECPKVLCMSFAFAV
jgi:hypothetical protein